MRGRRAPGSKGGKKRNEGCRGTQVKGDGSKLGKSRTPSVSEKAKKPLARGFLALPVPQLRRKRSRGAN